MQVILRLEVVEFGLGVKVLILALELLQQIFIYNLDRLVLLALSLLRQHEAQLFVFVHQVLHDLAIHDVN